MDISLFKGGFRLGDVRATMRAQTRGAFQPGAALPPDAPIDSGANATQPGAAPDPSANIPQGDQQQTGKRGWFARNGRILLMVAAATAVVVIVWKAFNRRKG